MKSTGTAKERRALRQAMLRSVIDDIEMLLCGEPKDTWRDWDDDIVFHGDFVAEEGEIMFDRIERAIKKGVKV